MKEPRPGVCKEVQPVRVKDADTITVGAYVEFDVRLLGPSADPENKGWYFDAPKSSTDEGQEAISRVIELIRNEDWPRDPSSNRFRKVKIFIPNKDDLKLIDFVNFNRVLAEMWCDHQRVGDVLLKEGHGEMKKLR